MFSYGRSDIFQDRRRLAPKAIQQYLCPRRHHRLLGVFLCSSAFLLGACERAPAEPTPPQPSTTSAPVQDPTPTTEQTGEAQPVNASGGSGSSSHEEATCVQPLPDAPPPAAMSLDVCPEDPYGRPTMPNGKLKFPEAPRAPELTVEVALTREHQQHGLMFRAELGDEEGMLFSYPDERRRSFWMHNTCLALDMLHLDKKGQIVAILEHVPPWNDTPRTTSCDAMHVLEVPAGWCRKYGIEPGQHALIDAPSP